jgi:P-type conjugative transfer protein TrbG
MPRLPLVISLLTVRALFGQSIPVDPQNPSPNSVVQLKRTPAPPALRLKRQIPLWIISISARTFGRWRSHGDACRTGAIPPPPAGLCRTRGLPACNRRCLSATAQQAVEFSASWRAQQNGAAPGPDGRVLFAFGAGLPTVVCAPLRVCLIELQPGEKLVGEPQIGDSVRWNVAPATFGKGDESTAMLVLKPQMPGLDTNLLITTDRRAYYVRLVSKANDYVSRVAFVYNDDDGGKKWKDHFAEQKREEIAAARNSVQTQPAVLFSVERLHFDYQIKGGDENIRPQRVFDDGSKTYIQMSPNVANREAPVLMVVGADGKGEVVNYRVKDQMYIVDRLFEHAQLVLGSGKKAQKVEINRDHRG